MSPAEFCDFMGAFAMETHRQFRHCRVLHGPNPEDCRFCQPISPQIWGIYLQNFLFTVFFGGKLTFFLHCFFFCGCHPQIWGENLQKKTVKKVSSEDSPPNLRVNLQNLPFYSVFLEVQPQIFGVATTKKMYKSKFWRFTPQILGWILTPTILFKIITRMKLLFSNYLGDYSYSFRGSSELINITVTASLFF